MHQELLKSAGERRFYRAGLAELAAELPPDDEALDELIGAAVAQRENDAFVRIVFAALAAGRRVDARHLARGACLFDHPDQLSAAALHVSGDVAGALIAAVLSETLGEERAAAALYLAGLWCKEHGVEPVPPELIAQARIRARRFGQNMLVDFQIALLSELLHDEGLDAVLDSQNVPRPPAALANTFFEEFVGPMRESPLAVVPERPDPVIHSGFTMRRAVARVGRNEPCPCGSGKKYKKCCMEKDEERLHESSPVPGMTKGELHAQRERFLTGEELVRMRSHELARLDPAKVDALLRPLLIDRLLLFGEREAAVELFEKTGVPQGLREDWLHCVDCVAEVGRKDLLVRLLQLRDSSELQHEDFPVAARLLMAEKPDVLRLIEEAALTALKNPDAPDNVDLAYALLDGPWPALGILVARGLIAHCGLFDAEVLLDEVLEARDKLNLSPHDPIQEVFGERISASIEAHRDSRELQDAQEKLRISNQELSDAKSKLTRLQAELDKAELDRKSRERKAVRLPAVTTPAPVQPLIDEAALQELRRRVVTLRDELRERHNERNQLRGELNRALDRLEVLNRKQQAELPAEESEDAEADWIDEAATEGAQPVRVPEFPPKFRASLQELPSRIVRQAMGSIGRMAAGDSGAFAGTKRLRSNRDIVRQRIGDHRLLFRLHPHTIELLALIPRRDLERKIKSLASG
jgi:mRNA-degrading endonuclease RelE of RelBE toxin-antitoxin system